MSSSIAPDLTRLPGAADILEPVPAPRWRRVLAGEPGFRDQLVRRVLVHIGRRREDEFVIRPLGWPGMVSLRFDAMVGAMATANLCRCLAQHPDQAVELVIRQLQFDRTPPGQAGQFYCAGDGPVPALYHPAPDRLANAVAPPHDAAPPKAPSHLGSFDGERKRNMGDIYEAYRVAEAKRRAGVVQDLIAFWSVVAFIAVLGAWLGAL